MAKQTKKTAPDQFRALANKVAKELQADLLLYNAPIERHFDQRVIELCNSMRRRKNVALFLITSGGDADAAYRIATCLQNKYQQFILLVPGYCKSAGTLVALGAHQIAISDQGENGPLDVQMLRKDELVGSESGLTATTALKTLNEQAYLAFEYFLLRITQGAGGTISTKTITDIAVKMTSGMFSHIYQQIDPMHVGEAERALQIAKAYGHRLVARSQNLKGESVDMLDHLISHYPSHGFIIDYGEAKKIFNRVRDFTADEAKLMSYLGPLGRWPVDREDDYRIVFISTEIAARRRQDVRRTGGSRSHVRQKKSGSAGKSREGTGDAAAATGTGPSVVAQIPSVQGVHKRHT